MLLDTYVEAIESELECWPGTDAKVVPRKKHRAVRITYGRHSRSIIIPKTGSDHRGPKNTVSLLRRTLKDMGATKLDRRPATKREQKAATANATVIARLGVNNTSVVLTIGRSSPLYERFVEDGKSKHYWTFELRANPDLKGTPHLAVVKQPDPTGKPKGMAKGFVNKQTNAFFVSIMRSQFKAIARMGTFATQPLELLSDHGDTLLFKLPANRKPLARQHDGEQPVHPQEEPEVVRAKHPAPAAPAAPVREAPVEEAPQPRASHTHPTPLVIQAPKEVVSLERAINVINKHKEKMGDNLRLSISEGGFLAVVAKFGRR